MSDYDGLRGAESWGQSLILADMGQVAKLLPSPTNAALGRTNRVCVRSSCFFSWCRSLSENRQPRNLSNAGKRYCLGKTGKHHCRNLVSVEAITCWRTFCEIPWRFTRHCRTQVISRVCREGLCARRNHESGRRLGTKRTLWAQACCPFAEYLATGFVRFGKGARQKTAYRGFA